MSDYNSSLPVRTENAGDVIAKIADATIPSQQLAVAADGSIAVTDNAGSLTVDAVDFDIRDLSYSQDSVAVRGIQDAGGDALAINSDGSLNVVISSNVAGDEINDFNTVATLAGGATSNHDYTVSVGKTLLLRQIEASGSGKMKIEVQVETGVATNTFTSKFVMFNSTAHPNMQLELLGPLSVAAGVRVRVIRTNRENQSQDVYSTICGQEV